VPYKDLYQYAQNLKIPVSRNVLRDKAVEISGVPKVSHVRTGMDLGVTRGLWLTPQNSNHHLVTQCGNNVIVTARDLNRCWERMVYLKELMHLFDEPSEVTSNREDFDNLLAEFASLGPIERSPQMTSEIIALWRALAILCPETQRQEFAAEREAITVDDYEIALRLRIPQVQVPRLFSPAFERMLKAIV
jgi:hypothetical protein